MKTLRAFGALGISLSVQYIDNRIPKHHLGMFYHGGDAKLSEHSYIHINTISFSLPAAMAASVLIMESFQGPRGVLDDNPPPAKRGNPGFC